MNLTAVILAHNEQENLPQCLKSLQWCPNVLVIDDLSTDKTSDIAKNSGAKVYLHALNQDFAAQRNVALQKVKTDWVLFVDADEQVSDKLAAEIKSVVTDTQNINNGYRLRRRDSFIGRVLRYGDSGQWNQIRLGRKQAGTWVGKVHEVWQMKQPIGQLSQPLTHLPHRTTAEFIQNINRYSTLRASELHQKGHRSNSLLIVAYPIAKFIRSYIIQQGYRDGTHGVVHALLMSFHSFLVRSKLYLLVKQASRSNK